jgi:hypothetical protein
MNDKNDLWKLSDDKLVDLLFTEEDRLERAVVDEFLRRGGLVERLGRIVSDPFNWNEPLPAWWAVVHAVYLLGAVGTPETVLPLLRALRYAEACENDWVTEDLPSIFGRIGLPACEALTAFAADRTNGWLARAIALEGLAAVTLGHPERTGDTFGLIRAYFADESEERPFRQLAGHVLLDFLRSECRGELEAFGREEERLADRDEAYKPSFTRRDVEEEFRGGQQALEIYTRDWLAFYREEAITERRGRWETDQRSRADAPEHKTSDELCPFAADRKRKKCCLGKAGLA